MSLLNLILLSVTPIAGLGVLLGIDRFEKFVLDGHGQHQAAGAIPEAALDITPAAVVTQAEPAHPAAA